VPLTLLFPPSLGRIRASTRAELLAESLTRRLGTQVTVAVADSYRALERSVLEQEVDLAWAPPSICARAEPVARAILKAVRRGRSTYRAALVTRVRDDLSLDTLRGRRAGWVDPLSAAGYLLPVALLESRGHDVGALLTEQRFFGSYRDALLALLAGECDLSAIYCHDRDETAVREILGEHVGPSEVQLAVQGYTDETPADGLILGARLSPADADRLIVGLAAVTDGSRGPTPLLELFDADTLVPAAPDDYAILRRALSLDTAAPPPRS
jgi:two-component system, NtrC family, sensor kinase